ncbi:hypothetical protein [Paenibacillus sp. Marseille-Q4541]|uniref:hypothetical protein n=1 Tax=Paenibacillus sp. Marseille-Q4541 TaxID=2831522 RepID=UPI001BAA2A3E|nr:hypothetical protein [Paenibacillus sp. Marseille-Q4541]
MKKSLTIASLVLAVSAVGTSAFASSDIGIEKINNPSKAISVNEAAKSDNVVDLVKMAKEKGITVDELIAQLEKEGKLTKAASLTEATKATGSNDSTMDSKATTITQSSEAISLDEMAKEKGITVDELIAQLEKEGKLVKAEKTTASTQAEKNNK